MTSGGCSTVVVTRNLLLIALAFAASVSSAEVLYLRDGSRVTGKLTVCDEDHCVIASKSVPLADVARIELRDDAGAPPLVAAGTIVLTDGTLQQARFLGLDLGVVETDGADIDRDTVALIILEPTILKPPVAMQRDVLIFADGSRSAGNLTSCSPASCMFDGERIQVDRLRWIGLRQEDGAPPVAAEAADLLVVDEEPVAARMSAISAKSVRTTHGTFARDRVTWIHLSPKSKKPSSPPAEASPAAERRPQSTHAWRERFNAGKAAGRRSRAAAIANANASSRL